MTTLDNVVREVVEVFMKDEELFTALDVSNKVKLTQPFARHSEVRDLVRELYTTYMQSKSWARSPISVTLNDGRQETALLYHPLSASWDLDEKYDAQKRQQASVKPTDPPPAPPVSTPAPQVTAPAPAPFLAAKDQWSQLFSTQPSLFPRK